MLSHFSWSESQPPILSYIPEPQHLQHCLINWGQEQDPDGSHRAQTKPAPQAKGTGTQSKTTPWPHKIHFRVSMTQSYRLPAVVPCQKNTVALWNQPEAGRQEDVGLNAAAADASWGNGNRETPREFNLIWKHAGPTQTRSTRGVQQNKGIKHYPPTALICFPSAPDTAHLSLPPLALLHTNF